LPWEDLQHESIESLAEFLQLRGDAEAEEWAKAALVNIVFRTRKDLLEKCTRMCFKAGLTETDAEEIANRTYERLLKYCKFKKSEGKGKTVEQSFNIYLYTIAAHELADHLNPDESPFDGTERVVFSLVDPNVQYEPEKLAELQAIETRLDTAMAGLTNKHKIIYLTYKMHEKVGRYLPKHLLAELHEVTGLTKSTVRVYKKQVFEQVEQRLYGKK
jgi:DNA-directed RNA polymerase specialized sigma24 family protein